MPQRTSRLTPVLAFAVGLGLLGAACAGSGDGTLPAPDSTPTSPATAAPATSPTIEPKAAALDVSLRDFTIDVSPATIPAGLARFDVTNDGDVAHQFVVIRSDLPADALPLTDSGFEVDLDRLDVVARAQSTDGDVSILRAQSARVETDLTSGSYVLICDVPGHYGSGMAATLSVR